MLGRISSPPTTPDNYRPSAIRQPKPFVDGGETCRGDTVAGKCLASLSAGPVSPCTNLTDRRRRTGRELTQRVPNTVILPTVMAWDDADLAEGIQEVFEAAAQLGSPGYCFDELELVTFGTQCVQWCDELGLNMGEALAMVGVHYSDRTGGRRVRRTRRQTKHCPVCACGVPTVYVTRRRRRSANVDFTIGQWHRRSFISSQEWTETSWICRNKKCDGFREVSEGTSCRVPRGLEGYSPALFM